MKKHILFFLLLLPTHIVSMQQESPITRIFYDKDILNHIVQQVCIVNKGVLKDVHRDLAALKTIDKQLCTYRIPPGCDAEIIKIFNQYDYCYSYTLSTKLKFSTAENYENLLEIAYQMENNTTSSKENLKNCNACYYHELLNITLRCRQFAAAKQLLTMSTLQLPPCHANYCINSKEILASGCPLVISTQLLLYNTDNLGHYQNKVNQYKTDLLEIITLLLKDHKKNPLHPSLPEFSILSNAIEQGNEELITLLISYGANPCIDKNHQNLMTRFPYYYEKYKAIQSL